MAPLAVAGKIVVGAGGGDFGARGFVDAYDAETGNRVLRRFWTVPSPAEGGWWGRWTETTPHGESLHRNIQKEERDSARYAEAWRHGGAAVWTTPAYHPVSGLVIFTTGNPAPVDGVTPPGDNLYSTSVVAVDVATGRLRWYYQMVPHNIWDYDRGESTGAPRPAARWGDASVGSPRREDWLGISARPARRSATPSRSSRWQTSSRPRLAPGYAPRPATAEAATGHPPRSPRSQGCSTFRPATPPWSLPSIQRPRPHGRQRWSFLAFARFEPAHPDSESGIVSAVDPATGRIRWQSRREDHLGSGGILVTAGGLVFFSEWDGHLTALDAESGKTLWRYRLDDGALGSPIAFEVDGEERIAVTSLARGLTEFGLVH